MFVILISGFIGLIHFDIWSTSKLLNYWQYLLVVAREDGILLSICNGLSDCLQGLVFTIPAVPVSSPTAAPITCLEGCSLIQLSLLNTNHSRPVELLTGRVGWERERGYLMLFTAYDDWLNWQLLECDTKHNQQIPPFLKLALDPTGPAHQVQSWLTPTLLCLTQRMWWVWVVWSLLWLTL